MEYKIFYPTALEEIKDPSNDNIDVCVKVGNQNYTLVFITPDNLKALMDSESENYIYPDFKYIVIRSLKKEYIDKAVEDIVKDKELLELYGL